MPRMHRHGYDHALRAAGAEIIDVGNADYTLGVAATNTKRWEVADAISEETAAIACLPKADNEISVATLADIAHDHDLPLIVDGAANLPPTRNLKRFLDAGADLVAFSGGKAVRGPQSTGFLAGRTDLISSAALQHLDMDIVEEMWDPPADVVDMDVPGVPRHGIGRGFKAGKEELVAFMTALEAFAEEDDRELQRAWNRRVGKMHEKLTSVSDIEVSVVGGNADPIEAKYRADILQNLSITVDESAGLTAIEIAKRLEDEDPRIYVGTSDVTDGKLSVSPFSITDNEAEYVADRIAYIVA